LPRWEKKGKKNRQDIIKGKEISGGKIQDRESSITPYVKEITTQIGVGKESLVKGVIEKHASLVKKGKR